MPYVRHIRVTANGGMPGGERWSCSVSFGLESPIILVSQPPLDTIAIGSAAAWASFVNGSLMSTQVTLQRVDVRQIDEDGTTMAMSASVPTTPAAGTGPVLLPNQCAVVCSLRTGTPGPKGRGRFYLPMLSTNPGPDGRLFPVVRNQIADNLAILVNALTTSVDVAFPNDQAWPIVASGAVVPANYRVTALRVGDVYDTQRRRRDALVEAYAVRAVA